MRRSLVLPVALLFAAFVWFGLLRDLRASRHAPAPRARTYVLEREQRITAPLETVVSFFEEPRNLEALTPPWMNFTITRVENLPMHAGTTMSYTISQYGIPIGWRTEIVEHMAGRGFVDLQVAGPYRYWRHQHTFESDGADTIMRDCVEYQMPFGLLGRLAHALFVERQLRRIFDHREEAIREVFGAG